MVELREITKDNSFWNQYHTYQGYHLFTGYKAIPPFIHVIFLETFSEEKS